MRVAHHSLVTNKPVALWFPIELEFRSVAFRGGRKTGEKPFEQGQEPTNLSHKWQQVWELNLGQIGGRWVLSPLHHPCSPKNDYYTVHFFTMWIYNCSHFFNGRFWSRILQNFWSSWMNSNSRSVENYFCSHFYLNGGWKKTLSLARDQGLL